MFSAIFITCMADADAIMACECPISPCCTMDLGFYGAIAFAIGVLAVRAYRRSQSDNFEKRNN